jgi:hypothetical protein
VKVSDRRDACSCHRSGIPAGGLTVPHGGYNRDP